MGGGGKYEGTGGVVPMRIAGRVQSERERLTQMTAEDRAWRMKWLKDQVLSPNEPRIVQVPQGQLLNPLRRFYRFPLDFFFERFVGKAIGQVNAEVFRFYTGRIFLGLWGTLAAFYYFKYNTNTWEGKGRWRVITSKTTVFPGDPGYPAVSPDREPHQYHDREFGKSILAQKFPQYQNANPKC